MPASGPYVSPNDELALKTTPKTMVTTVHNATPIPPPNASHERFGLTPPRRVLEDPAQGEPGERQGDRPADDDPDGVNEVVLAADVAAEGEEHERHDEEDADAHREEERPRVLLEAGPIALDPVDPVRRPLHLPHGGRPGDDRPDETQGEGQEAVVRPDLARLPHRIRQQLACEPRHRVLDRVDDHATDLEAPEGRREADERDEPLDEHQRYREGERPGVREAVRIPEPDQCVRDQSHASCLEERRLGVVAGQLPRLRHACRRAHDATGTQISIAAGSTSMSMDFTFSRSPPSSS